MSKREEFSEEEVYKESEGIDYAAAEAEEGSSHAEEAEAVTSGSNAKAPAVKELSIDYIRQKILQGEELIRGANGVDAVVLFGNTGVGKSTLSNYMAGKRIIPLIDRPFMSKKLQVHPDDESLFEVGHGGLSCTLFPKTVVIPGALGGIMDCPGFDGNRTAEDSAVESVSTELALRSLKSIKAALLCIRWDMIDNLRSGGLRDWVATIQKLFKSPLDAFNSMIFVITVLPNLDGCSSARFVREGVVPKLDQAIAAERKLLATLRSPGHQLSAADGRSEAECVFMINFLLRMRVSEGRCFAPNFLDNGESRKEIIEAINGGKLRKGHKPKDHVGYMQAMKASLDRKAARLRKGVLHILTPDFKGPTSSSVVSPTTWEAFDFSDYDFNRSSFNNAVRKVALSCLSVMKKFDSDYRTCSKNLELLPAFKVEIDNSKKALEYVRDAIQRKMGLSIVHQRAREVSEIKIKDMVEKISDLGEKIKSMEEEGLSLQAERLGIIEGEPVVVYRQQRVRAWGVMSYYRNGLKTEFSVVSPGNVPILDVEVNGVGGDWRKPIKDLGRGRYSIEYHLRADHTYKDTWAKVTARVERKLHPDNVLRLGEIDARSLVLKSAVAQLSKEKSGDVSSQVTLEKEVIEIEVNGKSKSSSSEYKLNFIVDSILKKSNEIIKLRKTLINTLIPAALSSYKEAAALGDKFSLLTLFSELFADNLPLKSVLDLHSKFSPVSEQFLISSLSRLSSVKEEVFAEGRSSPKPRSSTPVSRSSTPVSVAALRKNPGLLSGASFMTGSSMSPQTVVKTKREILVGKIAAKELGLQKLKEDLAKMDAAIKLGKGSPVSVETVHSDAQESPGNQANAGIEHESNSLCRPVAEVNKGDVGGVHSTSSSPSM